MSYNNFRAKIYFMDLKDILIYIFFTGILYTSYNIFILFNQDSTFNILKIIELAISIVLLIIVIHIRNISKKEIYGVIEIFLIINLLQVLIFISPNGQFVNIKEILNSIGYYDSFDFIYINMILFYFLIAKYRIDNNLKNIYLESILIIIFSITQSYMYSNFPNTYLFLIHLVYVFFVFSTTLKNLNKFKLNVDNKVDLLKLNVFFELIRFILTIISYVLNIPILKDCTVIVMQIILISTVVAIIVNIIKENYNLLFMETIERNDKLSEINKEIIKSNFQQESINIKLKERNSLYKNFLENFSYPIVIIKSNFRITYCNNSFLKEIGENKVKDVVNRRIDNYINLNERIKCKEIDNLKENFTLTLEINKKKVEIIIFRIQEEESEYILLFKDLTEEIKLLEMKEELREITMNEKIKRNFLSSISHDLKIPISVIYSAMQLEEVLINKNNANKMKYYNDISKENCLLLTKFTNNLIDISKIGCKSLEVNLSYDNIVGFIEEYLASLMPYISSNNINITFDTSNEEIYVYFDKEMMQRIILNLISNSIKYTKEGDSIFVNINDTEEYVQIQLEDTGIGMSEEFISKAFDKYEMENRLNNKVVGSGVGLYVVYNLLKSQNGDIEISSEIDKGSCFTMKLYKKRV